MAVTALIIDDAAASRQLIAYSLRQLGCIVVGEGETAADALRLFHQLKPDIVSLDLIMPSKDGIDSLGLVRAIKKEAPHAVIIVVSVIPSEKTRRDFMEEGVFAYLIKPFNDYALRTISLKLRRTFPELAAAR